MNLWMKRILGALPILGCGAGITVIAVAMTSKPMAAASVVICLVFGAIYILGAIAGMMLLEGHRYAITANFLYWLLQTVHFYSFVWTFVLWAPFNLGAWWNFTTSKAGISAQLGSAFRFTILNSNSDFIINLDVLAVACCAYLFVCYRREQRPHTRSQKD